MYWLQIAQYFFTLCVRLCSTNRRSLDDNILFLLEQVFKERDRYDYVIMLKRTKPYINDGTRKQTSDESDKIYNELCSLFNLFNIGYIVVGGDKAVDHIMDIINRNL